MSDFHTMSNQDQRRQAAATKRNRDVILNVLSKHLLDSGTILEVGSGTGEHAVHMAPHFPSHDWQPSDYDADNHASIEAWREQSDATNILPAILLDVMEPRWPIEMLRPVKPITAILAINVIHISPWSVTEALINGADRLLMTGGVLYFYGPYMVDGEHTALSNVQFDAWLKAQDQNWGVRNMEDVAEIARSYGFSAPEITPMPANNFSLVFKKL